MVASTLLCVVLADQQATYPGKIDAQEEAMKANPFLKDFQMTAHLRPTKCQGKPAGPWQKNFREDASCCTAAAKQNLPPYVPVPRRGLCDRNTLVHILWWRGLSLRGENQEGVLIRDV